MNVIIFWVRAMKCMCAQTKPWFILSSESFGGDGVWTHINSKGKIPSTGKFIQRRIEPAPLRTASPNTTNKLFWPPMVVYLCNYHSMAMYLYDYPSSKLKHTDYNSLASTSARACPHHPTPPPAPHSLSLTLSSSSSFLPSLFFSFSLFPHSLSFILSIPHSLSLFLSITETECKSANTGWSACTLSIMRMYLYHYHSVVVCHYNHHSLKADWPDSPE